MRQAIMAATVCALVVATGTLVFRVRSASGLSPWGPYEADINRDRKVNSTDMLIVAQNFGKQVPTATFTPTATPTLTPEPRAGGGVEQVLARNIVLQPGTRTQIGSVDPAACRGAVFYLAARSTDPIRATLLKVYVNGWVKDPGLQVEPQWTTALIHNFNAGGDVLYSQLNWGNVNPTVIAIEVNASLYAAEVSLEAHCEPAHE